MFIAICVMALFFPQMFFPYGLFMIEEPSKGEPGRNAMPPGSRAGKSGRKGLFDLRVAALLPALLAGPGCTTVESTPLPRLAQPLTKDLEERFSTPPIYNTEFLEVRRVDDIDYFKGRMELGMGAAGSRDSKREWVGFEVYIPNGKEKPLPFMLTLPILAGGKELTEFVCMKLARSGYAAGVVDRRGSLFRQHNHVDPKTNKTVKRYDTPEELEDFLTETIRHQRAFISWIGRHKEIDQSNLNAIGLSLGGIVGTTLVAVEPKLKTTGIVVAGAGLGDLMRNTDEPRVTGYRNGVMEADQISAEEFEKLMTATLISDPARMARYVDTDKVLMFSGVNDTTVPMRSSDLLWESLGRPERLLASVGHYTAAVTVDWIIDRYSDFLNER